MARRGGRRWSLARAHSAFVESGEVSPDVRGLVAASWRRASAAGVDADAVTAPITLDRPDLLEQREAHRLSVVFPLLYDVVGRIAEDCGYVMALGDEQGQLLWVCGEPRVLAQAESIHFAEGANWGETRAGTNAPGTALAIDAPVVIRAAEHFSRRVHPWSCAAAPIHDPSTRTVLGFLDITGDDEVATPQTLGMVRTAARMAEVELARIAAVEAARPAPPGRAARHDPGAPLRVCALGRPDAAVTIGGRSLRLSVRHSEILTLLLERPDGLTGDQLAVEVYPTDNQPSTIRAEMTRLRSLLGEDRLSSRPYRITGTARGDWQDVVRHLATGDLRRALATYRGPLLPFSEAPGVTELRETLHHRMRSALLASGDPDLLASWTGTRWGADDLVMWQHQVEWLPPSSPLRAIADAEAQRLEQRLR